MRTLTPEDRKMTAEKFLEEYELSTDPPLVPSDAIFTKGDALYLMKAYHLEASKTEMSGEVKSAEELLKEEVGGLFPWRSREIFCRVAVKYAAQFSQWRPIEELKGEAGADYLVCYMDEDSDLIYGMAHWVDRDTGGYLWLDHHLYQKPTLFKIIQPPNPDLLK